MSAHHHEPTAAMIAFYQKRTVAHIERVARCLFAIERVTDYGGQLSERARLHDASKFDEEERVPYIWLTEYYRCKRDNESFAFPEGMRQRVQHAIAHHLSTNRHHPEFHADPNQMTEVDLIEMVCDWTAMAQEFKQCDGSARGWADKTVGNGIDFDSQRTEFVYRMIDLLDRQLGQAP